MSHATKLVQTKKNFLKPQLLWIITHKPGEPDVQLYPGDVIFTYSREAPLSRMIALVTGGDISHVAMAVDSDGYIAEALEWGIETEHISKYRLKHEYYVARFYYRQTADMVGEAARKTALSPERKTRYGYFTIGSIFATYAYTWVTNRQYPSKRRFVGTGSGTRICSAYAADSIKPAGYYNEDVPSTHVTPFGLAEDMGVFNESYKSGPTDSYFREVAAGS